MTKVGPVSSGQAGGQEDSHIITISQLLMLLFLLQKRGSEALILICANT